LARFLIVEARFYGHLNDMLVAGAGAALKASEGRALALDVQFILGEHSD
jgi:6,7-dimethyl-8-ribityllumazine synthase